MYFLTVKKIKRLIFLMIAFGQIAETLDWNAYKDTQVGY